MIGGYFSFQGIDGSARWRRTPVEDVLPVTCLPYDDRVEVPEGFRRRSSGRTITQFWQGLAEIGRFCSAQMKFTLKIGLTFRCSPDFLRRMVGIPSW